MYEFVISVHLNRDETIAFQLNAETSYVITNLYISIDFSYFVCLLFDSFRNTCNVTERIHHFLINVFSSGFIL